MGWKKSSDQRPGNYKTYTLSSKISEEKKREILKDEKKEEQKGSGKKARTDITEKDYDFYQENKDWKSITIKNITLLVDEKEQTFPLWYVKHHSNNYFIKSIKVVSQTRRAFPNHNKGTLKIYSLGFALGTKQDLANQLNARDKGSGVFVKGEGRSKKAVDILYAEHDLESPNGTGGTYYILTTQLRLSGGRRGGGGGGSPGKAPSEAEVAKALRAITDEEKKIETAKIPITNFITGYNKRGYTLLFNFIAGNPYYQSAFVKRESGKFSSGVAKMGNLNSIDNDRLQTKITGYNEDALGVRGYIHLPLNVSLKSSQTFNYAAKAMALTADFTTSVLRGGVGGAIETAKQKIALGVDTSRTAQQFQGVYNKLLDDSVNIVTKTGVESGDIASGISANPRTYEQYTGTAVREFEFAWKFFARNEEESNAINELITKFRYHAAAKRGKSHPLRMANPDRVILRMYWVDDGNGEIMEEDEKKKKKVTKPEATYLHRFKPLVITGVDVQYGGDIPTYFEGTHAPTEINLTVKLKEQENVYADDIAIGY